MDLKSQIKARILSHARALGSTSKTVKCCHNFIMTKQKSPFDLLTHRTWERGANSKLLYLKRVREDRKERFFNSQGKLSPRQILARNKKRDFNITSRAQSYLERHWPYRRAESRWAGGNHYISVAISKEPFAECDTERVWSQNRKWSGNNTNASIGATRRTFKHFPNLVTPDGQVVIDAKKISSREYQIVWVENARGCSLKTVSGWLIKGFHVKGGTLDKARKKAAAARKKALSAELAKRQENADLVTIWVSLQDSLKAGNCETASKTVQDQLFRRFGKIGAIRADVLLAHRDDVYTRRAVAVAQQRTCKEA